MSFDLNGWHCCLFEDTNAIDIGPYADKRNVYFSICFADVMELVGRSEEWTNADESKSHPHRVGSIPLNGLRLAGIAFYHGIINNIEYNSQNNCFA